MNTVLLCKMANLVKCSDFLPFVRGIRHAVANVQNVHCGIQPSAKVLFGASHFERETISHKLSAGTHTLFASWYITPILHPYQSIKVERKPSCYVFNVETPARFDSNSTGVWISMPLQVKFE